MPKLTKRFVEWTAPDISRDITVRDSEIPGFGLRVWPSGKRTYVLKYRTAEGRQRKATLGQHGPVTAEQARKRAFKWLSEARHGVDPASEHTSLRRPPTLGDLAERYLAEHARVKKAAHSLGCDAAI